MLRQKLLLTAFLGSIAFGAAAAVPTAEDYGWTEYVSATGVFEVVMPDRIKTKISKLRINEVKALFSEETVATLDQRPYKNAMKNYIIRFDQTLGGAMNDEEKARLMDQEVNSYIDYYTEKGGILKDKRTEKTPLGLVLTDIYMTYKDEDMGEQGVKVRIEFSDSTRLQQVLTGPDHIMDTPRAKGFFETFKMYPGIADSVGKYEDEWNKHTSPLKIFSVLLPPAEMPYVPREPLVSHSDDAEKISFVFNDPLRAQKIFYDIYGYRADKPLTYTDAEELVLRRNVSQHLKRLDGVQIRRTTAGNLPGLEINYAVPRHKKFPFIERVKIHCLFIKNYMVVQQVVTSEILMDSDFVKNLMKQIEFHPKDAYKEYIKTHQSNEDTEKELQDFDNAG